MKDNSIINHSNDNYSPQIFICYAHKDNENRDPSKQWLDRLLEHLAPLELQGQADIWSDKEIELGEQWHEKIQGTLNQVKAAILLVSPSFLASKYIRNSELPVLLKNAKNKGVVILPILLRQCLWRETKFRFPDPKSGPEELSLSSIQVPSAKPLNSLEEDEQDEVLYQVTQRIHQIVNNDLSSSDVTSKTQPQATPASSFLSSLDSGNQEAIAIWQEKLAAYEIEEAITSDPEKKFQLKKLIKQCKQKIKELGG